MDSVWGAAHIAPRAPRDPCEPLPEHRGEQFHWLWHRPSRTWRPVEWHDGVWLGPLHVSSPLALALDGWVYGGPALAPVCFVERMSA